MLISVAALALATTLDAIRGGAAAGRLVPAFLTRVAQVNDCSRSPALVPFVVDDERVGAVPPPVVEALRSWPAVFDCTDPSRVVLSPELAEATLEQRSAAVHEVALALRESGLITKWRDEPLALVTAFDAPPALLVERRLVPLLGGKGYGVAINGYSHDERGELFLWVATRAADKATWPAMLDTLAAGAMSAGASVVAAARSEAAEEAGVPDELLTAGLKPVGAVSYRGPDEDPILPKVCDLTLTLSLTLNLTLILTLTCAAQGRRLLLLRPRAAVGLRARRSGRRGAPQRLSARARARPSNQEHTNAPAHQRNTAASAAPRRFHSRARLA